MSLWSCAFFWICGKIYNLDLVGSGICLGQCHLPTFIWHVSKLGLVIAAYSLLWHPSAQHSFSPTVSARLSGSNIVFTKLPHVTDWRMSTFQADIWLAFAILAPLHLQECVSCVVSCVTACWIFMCPGTPCYTVVAGFKMGLPCFLCQGPNFYSERCGRQKIPVCIEERWLPHTLLVMKSTSVELSRWKQLHISVSDEPYRSLMGNVF